MFHFGRQVSGTEGEGAKDGGQEEVAEVARERGSEGGRGEGSEGCKENDVRVGLLGLGFLLRCLLVCLCVSLPVCRIKVQRVRRKESSQYGGSFVTSFLKALF